MHRITFCFLALSGMLGVSALGGPIIYNNTTTDSGDTLAYAANGYTQLGDQITLAGVPRNATQATIQFFSDGGAGTFNATLRFFNVGSPVGTQIGSDFLLSGLSAPAGDIVNVTFLLGGLLLPDNVIFTAQVGTFSSGVDILGVDMFAPPGSVGSSDGTFAIAFNGSSFVTTNTTGGSVPLENVYFDLQATTPEPATIGIVGLGLLALILNRRRFA